MLARVPGDDGRDFHTEKAGRKEIEGGFVDAVDEVCSDLGRKEGKEIYCAGGDEIVPGGESEVAMEEEEEDEQQCDDVMRCFEEFVEAVS